MRPRGPSVEAGGMARAWKRASNVVLLPSEGFVLTKALSTNGQQVYLSEVCILQLHPRRTLANKHGSTAGLAAGSFLSAFPNLAATS